ncbi:MAG: DUF2254 domain-containing protein [Mycobacterium sp.]|nr:DUF2254 domain-containing protein [Mycobacterium sp.]
MSPLLASVRDTVRTQLWPLPAGGVLLALAAGIWLPRLDLHLNGRLPLWLTPLLFDGDPGSAQTLLDAIASSLITVTSLTFSLTVLTLQLASSQFSPRLLRTFTSDVFVQSTLAIFLATFTYALTVLRAIRSGGGGEPAFVPRISVTVAFVLGIVSVVGLVLFLAHLARQLRVETMLRDVHDDAIATLRSATRPLEGAPPQPKPPDPPATAVAITAPKSGFMTSINEAELLSAAIEASAHLMIECYPGCSIIEGVPIGVAWSDSGSLDDAALDRLRSGVSTAITVGHERTAAQDVGYGLRQLTDVANKALSPGINDPTTAIHALSHISAILCQLAGRELGPVTLRDDTGRVRVALRRPNLADVVEVAISQPRRYGSTDPQVMERLFRLLEELAWHVDDEALVGDQLARLRATVTRSDFDHAEIARLARAAQRVEEVITHHRDGGVR